jgi:cell division protein FtsI/penicillin-binding protein 2
MDELERLGARGSVVVLDPSTGGLLVMASTPTYNPETGLAEALNAPNSPLLNRATQGLYPPGSTFKVVTAASALDNGAVTVDQEFPGTDCIQTGGQELCNFRKRDYGTHDFGYALVHSINTTFAEVGIALGQEQLEETMRDFGFFKRFPWDYPPEQTLPSGRPRVEAIGRGRYFAPFYPPKICTQPPPAHSTYGHQDRHQRLRPHRPQRLPHRLLTPRARGGVHQRPHRCQDAGVLAQVRLGPRPF